MPHFGTHSDAKRRQYYTGLPTGKTTANAEPPAGADTLSETSLLSGKVFDHANLSNWNVALVGLFLIDIRYFVVTMSVHGQSRMV